MAHVAEYSIMQKPRSYGTATSKTFAQHENRSRYRQSHFRNAKKFGHKKQVRITLLF